MNPVTETALDRLLDTLEGVERMAVLAALDRILKVSYNEGYDKGYSDGKPWDEDL